MAARDRPWCSQSAFIQFNWNCVTLGEVLDEIRERHVEHIDVDLGGERLGNRRVGSIGRDRGLLLPAADAGNGENRRDKRSTQHGAPIPGTHGLSPVFRSSSKTSPSCLNVATVLRAVANLSFNWRH